MLALIIGIVVALGAVALVLAPIVFPERVRVPEPEEPEADPREHRKDLALAALKEIEFDRATGKLDDADYERMKASYTAEALDAIREADAATAPREPALAKRQVAAGVGAATLDAGAAASDDPAEALIAAKRKAARSGRKFCSECGAELELAGKFCVECGARAGQA